METTAAMQADAQQQFSLLLEQHRGIVLKVAHSYAWNPDDRAELAQEIAAQAWRAFPAYDPGRRFSTWRYRIPLNVSISFARGDGLRRGHAVPLDEDAHELADTTATDPARELQVRALQAFIAALPPLDRALLLLYLEDRGYREIADILGISQTNVSTRISRLKQRIRNEL